MSRRNGEPVKHTCPDIDRIKSTITSIVNDMKGVGEDDLEKSLLETINDWVLELESIGVGKWCELESLRDSNSALREWGCEMYNEAEKLEEERDEFESEVEKLKSQVSELESQIEELALVS
jgi:chromosome segregation ATPase